MSKETILAWHFCHKNRKLRYDDNRDIIEGETLTVSDTPKLCESGLHGSVRVLDALTYAVDPTLCRVELGGTLIKSNDKIAATSRKCLKIIDATDVLCRFKQVVANIYVNRFCIDIKDNRFAQRILNSNECVHNDWGNTREIVENIKKDSESLGRQAKLYDNLHNLIRFVLLNTPKSASVTSSTIQTLRYIYKIIQLYHYNDSKKSHEEILKCKEDTNSLLERMLSEKL